MPAPTPPADVAGGAPATSAWANAVADAVQQLIADLYPAGVLGVAWASVSGKPTAFAPSVHAHTDDPVTGGPVGYGDLAGKPSTFAPSGHAHADAASGGKIAYANVTGTPATAWKFAGTGSNGTIFGGTSTPSGAVEGDIWVKG
jgi:hypothetical protein